MHKTSAIFFAFLLSSGIAGQAFAQPDTTVVVTATRTQQQQSRTGDSISVITADDLKALQTVAISDALAQTPGLAVVRNGGPGQTTTIGLRGAEAGQTLVLIDGVRINDPSTVDGEALLGDLFVNGIARIEVLRGPQSTLYGSDAIGGVVNIITKRGGDDPFDFAASAEGGSFDSYRINASANGTLAALDYGVAANYFHSNGISAADARLGNLETDGTTNLGLTANLRYHVTSALSLDVRLWQTNARTGFDDNYLPPAYQVSDSPVYARNTFLGGYAGINFALFEGRFRNRIAYTGSLGKRTVYDSPFYLPLHQDYFYRGSAERFEYQGIVDLSKTDQITFGAETERTALNSGFAGFPDARGHNRITGIYLQGQTTLFSELTVTGGIRYDDDREFGGHTSLKIAAAWSPNNGETVLRANYGDGFKAPTLYELFSVYSNPVMPLAPETARGWEAGIDQSFWNGRIRMHATWFERHTKNQIDFFSCYGVTSPACTLRSAVGGYYYNVGRSTSRGLELSAHAGLSDTLGIDAMYTYMEATDTIAHTDLARRPRNLASLSAQWHPTKDWRFGVAAVYVGHRFDGAYETTPLPSHITANLLASYRLNENAELFGRIENLFDARYEPVAGYGAPGRAVYAGIRFTDGK